MQISDLKIKYFGSQVSEKEIISKINFIKKEIDKFQFYLIIAGTNTSQIEGISAAGIDSQSRKITALADAEFLLNGITPTYKYKLPVLKAGVTPALISNVCARLLKADLQVIPIGVHKNPYFKHLIVEDTLGSPANCLSTGKAMKKARVRNLYKKGLSMGILIKNPILIAESVPGGTTTAQATMEAFGLNVSNLVGSSLLHPPRELKKEIVSTGIFNANFKKDSDVIDIISAIGDPFQAFSMGLLIGARKSNNIVILAGGSQMVALLLLAFEYISSKDKEKFANNVFVATTGWLTSDDSLNKLLNLVAKKHNVNLFGFASNLNFNSSHIKELKDFELGYVKEGVGAGGMSLLAYLKGFNYEEIVSNCESNIIKMKELGEAINYHHLK
tara:strand:- start:4064 stop:5224 length:1161 start_codon:yes stop_codon:yes gene_type:complete